MKRFFIDIILLVMQSAIFGWHRSQHVKLNINTAYIHLSGFSGSVCFLMCSCIVGTMGMFYKRSNRRLVQLPVDIPSYTVAVDLSYNKINYLGRTTFIEYLRCTDLDLHCNHIVEINIGSFSSFLNIENSEIRS